MVVTGSTGLLRRCLLLRSAGLARGVLRREEQTRGDVFTSRRSGRWKPRGDCQGADCGRKVSYVGPGPAVCVVLGCGSASISSAVRILWRQFRHVRQRRIRSGALAGFGDFPGSAAAPEQTMPGGSPRRGGVGDGRRSIVFSLFLRNRVTFFARSLGVLPGAPPLVSGLSYGREGLEGPSRSGPMLFAGAHRGRCCRTTAVARSSPEVSSWTGWTNTETQFLERLCSHRHHHTRSVGLRYIFEVEHLLRLFTGAPAAVPRSRMHSWIETPTVQPTRQSHRWLSRPTRSNPLVDFEAGDAVGRLRLLGTAARRFCETIWWSAGVAVEQSQAVSRA